MLRHHQIIVPLEGIVTTGTEFEPPRILTPVRAELLPGTIGSHWSRTNTAETKVILAGPCFDANMNASVPATK